MADEQRATAGFIVAVFVVLHLLFLASGASAKALRPEEQLCLTSSHTNMTQKRSQ